MKLKSHFAVLVTSLAPSFTASAAPSTWHGAFVLNGTGGGWLALPNSEYFGINNLYYTVGSDENGAFANPNGGINVPLAVGEQTFTALGSMGSNSLTSERTIILNFAGWGADTLTWTSTGPASVSVSDKLDPQYRITLGNVTYRDPMQGTPDRVGLNAVSPDGLTDTVHLHAHG